MVYSIGEFSRITGLTVKTLRFYHEKELLEPAAIDHQSGYRYYDDRNVESARAIRVLRDFEFSLEDIRAILAEGANNLDIVAHLEQRRDSLCEKVQHYQDLRRTIDQLITQERELRKEVEMSQQSFEIEERDVEPLLMAGYRMQGKYSDCGKGFSLLGKKVGRFINGKPFCLYFDGEYREEDANFEACFPIRREIEVDGISVRTLPAVRCVTLVHRGPYNTLTRSYERVMKYLKEKNLCLSLPTREVYLKGPGMIFKGNEKKYLTEIQIPIAE